LVTINQVFAAAGSSKDPESIEGGFEKPQRITGHRHLLSSHFCRILAVSLLKTPEIGCVAG